MEIPNRIEEDVALLKKLMLKMFINNIGKSNLPLVLLSSKTKSWILFEKS